MWPALLKSASLLFILTAVAFEALADILFKKWALGSHAGFWIAGFALYLLGTVAWAWSLKYEYLSRAITVFTVLNLVIVAFAGAVLFKEDLSLPNKIGILLGVASVILLEL